LCGHLQGSTNKYTINSYKCVRTNTTVHLLLLILYSTVCQFMVYNVCQFIVYNVCQFMVYNVR
jgi:hypothetical protein